MPFILIKNYLKLMLRNKWILLMMAILPVIVIALLSNSFKDIMDTAHKIDKFQVGYRVSEDSSFAGALPQLKNVCEENGVILIEYPEQDISGLMTNKTVAAFVDITDHSYTIYQSGEKKIEASITESIFSNFFYGMNSKMTEMTYTLENSITEVKELNDVRVKSEKLDTDPVPSSLDYYGIAFLMYITWSAMIILVSVISSERKGSVLKRMRVAQKSRFYSYLGKFIPGTLAIFIEACTAWIITVLLLDIHWGNIGMSVVIVFLTSMATAVLGIFLFQLFKNVAIGIVSGFVFIWIMGFFGGAFQSYMYNFLPQKLVDLSPLYYINRTLVEFSTKGSSAYTGPCLIYLFIVILFLGITGILLMNRKLEEM